MRTLIKLKKGENNLLQVHFTIDLPMHMYF